MSTTENSAPAQPSAPVPTPPATTNEPAKPANEQPSEAPSFTQADVDRIVTERLNRERAKLAKATETPAADKSAEDRIKALEDELTTTRRDALVRRVQARYSISDADADLFLTGADEEALDAQAKRLAAFETDRKKPSNVVPNEGNTGNDKSTEERDFLRSLVQ